MLIRLATEADLDTCLALDADSQTDHVWQMDQRKEGDGRAVRFQTVRLPRIMRVAYPRDRDDLPACLENDSAILVATDKPAVEPDEEEIELIEELEPARIYGFCQVDSLAWQRTCWINHLVVDRRLRRRGIGTALLHACIAWGRHHQFDRLMIAVQTKNYPGISFCEKHGFTFCGFNDQYFPNRDIALFFSLRI